MANEVTTEHCKQCVHGEATDIFELCTHAASEYTVNGKKDHHTTWHMRNHGACHKDANFFMRRYS